MRLAQRTEEGFFLVGDRTLSVDDVIYPIEAQSAIDAFFALHEEQARANRALLDRRREDETETKNIACCEALFARLRREEAACRAALAVFAAFGVLFPIYADYEKKQLRVAGYAYPDSTLGLLGIFLFRDSEKHRNFFIGEL